MLLRFSFENFRTFREKTTLSMLATTQRTLNDVLIRKGKHRILPSAVLYGANASGKSNVILALHTLREIVLNGTVTHQKTPVLLNLDLFPFVHDNNTAPIFFEVEFIENDIQFIYHLSISVESLNPHGNRSVREESLQMVLPKTTAMIFRRTKANVEIGTDKQSLKALGYNNNDDTLRRLIAKLNENMDEVTLFLTGGFKSVISRTLADTAIGYITSKILTVIGSFDTYLDHLLPVLPSSIDTTTPDSPLITNELFDVIMKAADLGPQQIGFLPKENTGGSQGFSLYEMVSKYRNIIVPAIFMESTGTITLLKFMLMFRQYITRGGLLLIDELDSSIHPEIVKAIIAMLGNPDVNKSGTQLIFTSHNPIFMDRDLLRRDQILFTERNPDTFTSTLHSLGDFGSVSVRNDQDFIRNYFKGRYGRLPYIDLETIFTSGFSAEG